MLGLGDRPAAAFSVAGRTGLFEAWSTCGRVRRVRTAASQAVDLGISHPCSAFYRRPDITVVDDQGHTCDVCHPQFH